MTAKGKSNNKNLKALFSVICLCIVALGLIVYFSTQTKSTTDVNEATTVAETTKAVQNAVTVKETTTKKVTTTNTTQAKSTTKKSKETTTEVATMEVGDTNTPYQSFYKYPCDETAIAGYTEELVKNDTMGDYRSHTAIDFKASAGTKIVAINDGLVTSIRTDNLLGKVIEIDHGGKLVATYCGFDTVNVTEGEFVTIGQTLGTIGNVPFEASSESHLHFETKLDGKYVNPLDVMGKTE